MVKNKSEVIKHSAAIHMQNNITLLQRRAWNALLANAYDDLLTTDKHAMKVKDLMWTLEFESHNEEYLKEALQALISCKVEWNVFGKDREKDWIATTLLAEARINNGVLTYAYAPTLREGLHNPRMYARLSLSMQNKFSSKHAQALWELCVDALDETRKYGETPFILLADYRKFLGLPEEVYPEFKKLNKWVIKDPIAEVNRVTDFQAKAEYKREGRHVRAVKFKVHQVERLPKPAAKSRQGVFWPEITDMPTAVRELKEAGMAADEAWKIWQEGFNYVETDKRPINLKDNPEVAFDRYVLEKVHLLRRQREAGKVKNITGFLCTAIKKNYANPEFVIEEKKQRVREETKAKSMTERQQQLLEEQKSELQTNRDKELHQLCEQIAQETPALLEQVTTEIFKENPFLKKSCEPGKTLLESYHEKPMLRVMVDQYLMNHYPERFRAIRKRYASQLAAVAPQMVGEQRANV